MFACRFDQMVKSASGHHGIISTNQCGHLKLLCLERLPSEKMLIQQLRQLEEDGLVKRQQYPEVPPRVEYPLSAKGRTLVPLFQYIGDWGREHLSDRLVSTRE